MKGTAARSLTLGHNCPEVPWKLGDREAMRERDRRLKTDPGIGSAPPARGSVAARRAARILRGIVPVRLIGGFETAARKPRAGGADPIPGSGFSRRSPSSVVFHSYGISSVSSALALPRNRRERVTAQNV